MSKATREKRAETVGGIVGRIVRMILSLLKQGMQSLGTVVLTTYRQEGIIPGLLAFGLSYIIVGLILSLTPLPFHYAVFIGMVVTLLSTIWTAYDDRKQGSTDIVSAEEYRFVGLWASNRTVYEKR